MEHCDIMDPKGEYHDCMCKELYNIQKEYIMVVLCV